MELFSFCVVDVTGTQEENIVIKPAADEGSAVRAVKCGRRRADPKTDQRQKYVIINHSQRSKKRSLRSRNPYV